jgi:hypothetical protein
MPHVIPDQNGDPQEFAIFTRESWRDLDATYQFWVNRWKRTMEYTRSQHWNTLKKFDPEKLPTWKRFPVINYVLAFYQNYLQDFLKSEIRFTALPASPDPEDINSAELIEQLNKFIWDKTEMSTKRIQLASWLLTCGTAYLRVFWDTNTGVPIDIPFPDGQSVTVDKGEIGIEVVSPQYVRFSPNPSHGAMIGLLLSREEATSLFGPKAEDLKYSSTYDDFDANLHAIETPTTAPSKDERAMVIQHYIPRSSLHPDGLWWTMGGADVVLNGPYPLPGGEIPIVPFVWLPVPGHPYIGQSPLYDVTFNNKIYDELMARVLEWHNKVKPKILLKSGGGITYGDMNEEPFQEVVVAPGAEPEFMETRQVPDTFYKSMQDAQNDMMMVAGYALGPNGEATQGLGQNTATNRFRTPDHPIEQGPTAVAIMNSRASWEHLGRLIPAYASEFYTEPRVIAVQGPDRRYQWKQFVGALDIKNVSATIKVDETALYPWSRAALRDSVTSIMETQFGQILFMDPATGQPNLERIHAAMNATGIDVAIPSIDPDITEARNEHMMFEEMTSPQQSQQAPQPEFWQNHQAHLDEHETVLKSLSFQKWPDPGKQAFVQHVQATAQLMNQAAQEEQQSMIDMERALREVRETAELQADIKEMIAEAVIDAMREAIRWEDPKRLSEVELDLAKAEQARATARKPASSGD